MLNMFPFTIAVGLSIVLSFRIRAFAKIFLKGQMYQFENTSLKKQFNHVQFAKLMGFGLNLSTFLISSFITGYELYVGIKLRFFTPMKFEKQLASNNINHICAYHRILTWPMQVPIQTNYIKTIKIILQYFYIINSNTYRYCKWLKTININVYI